LCGVESWYTTSVDCDYFPSIEFRETCYIQTSYNPCNMSDFTCYKPHYDMDGNWQYEDCSDTLLNYDAWNRVRTHYYWHDRSQDQYNVYVHEHWDQYHGIEDDLFNGVDTSDLALFSDYDTWDCEDQQCEWVDCEENEQYWDNRDCWKELCYGCDSMVCQLWYWDEYTQDWFTEDCVQQYAEMEPTGTDDYDMALNVAGDFNESLGLAEDTYCGNFTCIEMLGHMAAQALASA